MSHNMHGVHHHQHMHDYTQGMAVKACGGLIEVEPNEFLRVLGTEEAPLVVYGTRGIFKTTHRYLMGYRGLVFHCKSSEKLTLPRSVVLVEARKVSIPDV